MKTSARLFAFIVFGSSCLAFAADAPPTTAPGKDNVAKLLELGDPEVAALKKMDYKSVDYAKVDLKTRTMAVMAMNKLLSQHGERAVRRIGLLEDFIQYKKLDESFSQSTDTAPDEDRLTMEDGLKIAVLIVRTAEGQEAWSSSVTNVSDQTLERVYASYLNLCKKRWGEVTYQRFRVEELAQFIDSKKMFNEFVIWGRDETARRKQARAEEAAKYRAAQKAEEDKARAARIAQYDKERDRQQQLVLKQMEYRTAVDSARASRPTYYYGGWGDWW